MALQKRGSWKLIIIIIFCGLMYFYCRIFDKIWKNEESSKQLMNRELLTISESSDYNTYLQYENNNNISSTEKLNENSMTNMAITVKPRCRYGFSAKYGSYFDKDVTFESAKYALINISRAFGCSTNVKYCYGEIKAIPCCIKIVYDMWYALDKYLVKYGVTYSLNWGSLLMAVRDGRHAAWDAKDVDLGFLWPVYNASIAIKEFMNDYGLSKDGSHHIVDWKQKFYEIHHSKYGYPSKDKHYCFYHEIGVAATKYSHQSRNGKLQLDELLDNEDGLILAGTSTFIDFVTGSVKTEGMGNYAKHIHFDKTRMVKVEYIGSNGILPPREIYVFPDYYKQLYYLYGDIWPYGYQFLSEKQLKYYGLNVFNISYFKTIYKKTWKIIHLRGKSNKYRNEKAQNDERFIKFRDLFPDLFFEATGEKVKFTY